MPRTPDGNIERIKTDDRPPRFGWDYWEEEALARGLDPELAALGRAVIREAAGHNWSPQLRVLCSGEVLERILFRAPDLAGRLCGVLLETDGLRVAADEGDGAGGEMIGLGEDYF